MISLMDYGLGRMPMERHLHLRLNKDPMERLWGLPIERHLNLRRMVTMERYLSIPMANRLGKLPVERHLNLNFSLNRDPKEGCWGQLEGEGPLIMQWGPRCPSPTAYSPTSSNIISSSHYNNHTTATTTTTSSIWRPTGQEGPLQAPQGEWPSP